MKQIPLSQNQYAIVDDEDYEYLNQWKWWVQKNGNSFYAIRNGKPIKGKHQTIRMHRVIMKHPQNMQIDHINHNPLDNRRSNLRIVTSQQNTMNKLRSKNKKSKYKGAFYTKENNRWRSLIQYKGKSKHLGYFEKEIDAAITYNIAAKKYFGQYACLNKIPDKYKNRIPVEYKPKYTSKIKGVTWDKNCNKWRAYVLQNKKKIHLGCFTNELNAAQEVFNYYK